MSFINIQVMFLSQHVSYVSAFLWIGFSVVPVSCTCGIGKYSDNGTCVNCEPGTFSIDNSTFCTECTPGTFSGFNAGICTPCLICDVNVTYINVPCALDSDTECAPCETCKEGFY